MWINEPIVYPLTIPSSHKITSTPAIVYNILSSKECFSRKKVWFLWARRIFPLSAPFPNNQENDAAREGDPAHDRGQRYCPRFLSRHLKRAEIDDFFLGRVGDALICKGRYADDDQQDSDYA